MDFIRINNNHRSICGEKMICRIAASERTVLSAYQDFSSVCSCINFILGVMVPCRTISISGSLHDGFILLQSDRIVQDHRLLLEMCQSAPFKQLGTIADLTVQVSPSLSLNKFIWPPGAGEIIGSIRPFCIRLSRIFERLPVRMKNRASPRECMMSRRTLEAFLYCHLEVSMTVDMDFWKMNIPAVLLNITFSVFYSLAGKDANREGLSDY